MLNVVYKYELAPNGAEWRVSGVALREECPQRFMLPVPAKWESNMTANANIADHTVREAVIKFFTDFGDKDVNVIKI